MADLEVAYALGRMLTEKMVSPDEVNIDSKPLKFGDKYKNRTEWVSKNLKRMILGPVHHEDKCIQCNKCMEACPAEAVSLEYSIDEDACIKCMGCVRICPTDAMTVSFPPPVSQFMNSWGQKRKEPKIYL